MNKVKRYVVLFLSSLVLASCGNSSSNSSSIESSLSSNTTLISSSSSSTVLSSSTSSNISSSNSQVSSSSSSSTKLENWPTTEDKNSTGERMTISEIYDYAKTIKLKESMVVLTRLIKITKEIEHLTFMKISSQKKLFLVVNI